MAGGRLTDNELAQALVALQTPTPLLKFGTSGKPKFRKFSLSADFRRLRWSSPNKESEIALDAVVSIKFGQRTEKFARNRRADLDHLSFSLLHYSRPAPPSTVGTTPHVGSVRRSSHSPSRSAAGSTSTLSGSGPIDTLDLVCKDEAEWRTWTAVLSGLHNRTISEAVIEKALELTNACKGAPEAAAFHAGRALNATSDDVSQVYTWGSGCWGASAHGDLEMRTKPEIVKGAVGQGVTGLACGWAHTVFLMESGEVWASGHRAGTGLPTDNNILMQVPLPAKVEVVQLACGSYHSLARTATGSVLSWGSNLRGQLGHGDTADRERPTPIDSVQGRIVNLACGSNASALVDAAGALLTFGQGDMGFTGHGHDRDVLVPTALGEFGPQNPVLSVAAGDCHMVAVAAQGVFSWGWNMCGQLGQGHFADVCGAAHSAIILHHTVTDLYELFTWGANSTGQCAQRRNQTTPNLCTPTPVELRFGPSKLLAVECGAYHLALLTYPHGLWHAGSNTYGQLGLDTTAHEASYELAPCKLSPKTGIAQVACGATHSCILVNESWVDDQHCPVCMACKLEFTRFRRRHHCRACGGIFCAACSANRSAILRKGVTAPVRVCDACFAKLSR
ncbi:hypothetical protein PBRA_007732 [Plasmodiophora brassicae]|uniref:FYVE-type domain-containing protein n=1 Tax=Plasmodiophora brassicae TaxID=37360 RepID=A0A0G4IXC0_PLABS|nr:hypothetical protein PBRA_007732 [Plasmodiophora brassicae]